MIITTTKGPMEENLLEKKVGTVDNDNEHTNWVEYWLDGELVHRSVHVRLKANVTSKTELGEFGG